MDYTVIALESSLETLKMIQAYEVTTMLEEAAYIETCLESGFIPVIEAEEKKGIIRSIIDAAKNFINNFLNLFRTRSAEKCVMYVEWVQTNISIFPKRATSHPALKLMPLWHGDWKKGADELTRAMDLAYNNYNAKKFDDYSWANKLVKDVSGIPEKDSNMADYLKNKFRYDVLGESSMAPVIVEGRELSQITTIAAEYIVDYEKNVVNSVKTITDKYKKRLETLKIPDESTVTTASSEKPASENTRILLYDGKPVCETELVNMVNYSMVFEDDKSSTTTTSSDKKDGPIDDKSSKDNEKITSTSQVKTVGDEKTDDKNNSDGKSGESTTDSAGTEYLKNIDRFFKLATTAYSTACEERFTSFVNLMLTIGDDTGKAPKFKNGKWIRPSDSKEAVKVEKTSVDDDGNEVGKQKKGVKNRIKDMYKNAKNNLKKVGKKNS